MDTGSGDRTPAATGAALGGLALGAALSSLLGTPIFAGFLAVSLAAGAALALAALAGAGRPLALAGGGVVMLFPLATAEIGEDGILWAAAAATIVLGLAHVIRGVRPGSLISLAAALGVVLHLGLLGAYLVLASAQDSLLLLALVVMVVCFEAAYGITAARTATRPPVRGRQTSRPPVNPKAVLAGVAACGGAALLTRFFLPAPLGLGSLLVLGTIVGGGASLGHVAAAAVHEDLESRSRHGGGFDPAVFTHLNALLFAAGAFHYGFRLYLA